MELEIKFKDGTSKKFTNIKDCITFLKTYEGEIEGGKSKEQIIENLEYLDSGRIILGGDNVEQGDKE